MPVTIAVDVGGTHMRAAVFSDNKISPRFQTRIRTYSGGESSLDCLMHLINKLIPAGESTHGIGVAVPGPIDPHKGVILTAPNLREWIGVPIAQMISEQFGVPAALGNDANLAALGE